MTTKNISFIDILQDSPLILGNKAMRSKDYEMAISFYGNALLSNPELARIISANLSLAKKKLNLELSRERRVASKPAMWVKEDEALDLSLKNEIEKIVLSRLSGKPVRVSEDFDFAKEKYFLSLVQKGAAYFSAKASIVMPTYNRGYIIESAINSVLAQEHENWELYIVDDGSTDNTTLKLKTYTADSRIKVLRTNRVGVSAARNLGLKKVVGSHIFYLDSDNTWKPNYLKSMLAAFFVSGRQTGYCGTSIINEHNSVVGYRGEPFDWNRCHESNYIDLNVFGHSIELLQNMGGFDETLRRMVDWDLILRFTKHATPFYAPFIGCNYLSSDNDLSRISVSEPRMFKKIVQLKNNDAVRTPEKIAKSLKINFAIKIPAPYEKRDEWGDYHFAESLKNALEKLGHKVFIDYHNKWYDRPYTEDDVVIVLRGLTKYTPNKEHINIIWNISHPDQVSFDEYNQFHLAFSASLSHSKFLATFLRTSIEPLLQCTDASRFYYSESKIPQNSVLFVGNSRNEHRPIIRMAVESGRAVDIYGTKWQQFVSPEKIRGENIENKKLRSFYSSHVAVLNDHWESMRAYGYISNRVFDVLASGGRLISDFVPSIKQVFGDSVFQVQCSNDINLAVEKIIFQNNSESENRVKLSNYILQNHSFDARAKKIVGSTMQKLGLPISAAEDGNIALRIKSGDKIINIGFLLQNGSTRLTSSAYIRLISPLTAEAASGCVEPIILDGVDDERISECDVLLVQRVAIKTEKEALKILELSNKNKIHLVVDNDDAFAAMDESHLEFEKYKSSDVILKFLMKNADDVWLSTKPLADLYKREAPEAYVIPNAIDLRLWRDFRKARPEPLSKGIFRFLYMGTATHDGDFSIVLPALDALHEMRENSFELVVIGALKNPPRRTWLKVVTPPSDKTLYPYFVHWLRGSGQYNAGLAPLVINKFNRCKSDIKFLDYTALGIPTICSRCEAYEMPIDKGLAIGCENSLQGWLNSLIFSLDNQDKMGEMLKEAWSHVWSDRETSKIAKQQIERLKEKISNKSNSLKQNLNFQKESETQMACNLCGCLDFIAQGKRDKVKCAHCGSLERTRLLWLYIEKLNIKSDFKILHLAPELGIYRKIKDLVPLENYTVADLNPKNFNFAKNATKINLCELEEWPPNSYDLIIHSHVLEHVPCNIAYSLFHLHRMLKPTGRHLCIIPFSPGRWDECFDNLDDTERVLRFGQADHVRKFGKDDIENHIGKILKLPVNFDATTVFSPETLHSSNIPENNWAGFHAGTVLCLNKSDINF